MEVRIGVVHSVKELTLELDGDLDEAIGRIEQALKGGEPIVWLTDSRGRRVGVPPDKLAYVEVEGEDSHKRVGFGRV